MKKVIFNTDGTTSIVDIDAEENEEVLDTPTIEDRVSALEGVMLDMIVGGTDA